MTTIDDKAATLRAARTGSHPIVADEADRADLGEQVEAELAADLPLRAEIRFRMAIIADPASARARAGHAAALERRDDLVGTLSALRRAFRPAPNDFTISRELGRTKRRSTSRVAPPLRPPPTNPRDSHSPKPTLQHERSST